jgi:predicted ATPase
VSESATAAPGDGPLRVFISYRRQDSAPYAGRLYDDLTERFGQGQVFIDLDAIEAGADFEQVIVETVKRADVLLAVVGPLWLTATDERGRRRLDIEDDFVRRELEVALEEGSVKVIPLLVQEARMPNPEDLPASVAAFSRRQALVMSDRRWRADVAELVGALERLAARKAGSPAAVAQPVQGPAAATPVAPRRARLLGLPHHRTRFVGRDDDMKRVHELLGSTGFVTIVGPGGVGKSRLAVEAARAVESQYEDGVCLTELASFADPSLVPQAVARATGADELQRDSTLETLVEGLADRRLLLILDNCEHLIDEVATLAEALVQRCPALHVLATSREALQVDGEAVWRLAPLSAPDLDRTLTAVDLTGYPAAMLFADRAALAAPSFRLDDRAAPSIGRIAAALDGLPLALELAAASLRSLDLDEVVGGLSTRLVTIGAQRRTTQTRQRTLWATVDWSYQLLDEGERRLLERLGVFAGSFAIGHAEYVCGTGMPPGTVAPTIVRLVESSLVNPVEDHGPGGRFRLLYTVRDYARTRLGSRADDPTPARLQAWGAEVARIHGRAVDVGDELAGLQFLDAEHPNLIAALTLALEAANVSVVCQIASSLAPYWEIRGLRVEGLKWVEQALALSPPDDALRGACLLAAARLAPTADFDGRRRRSREALAAADLAGDDALASAALASLGHIDFETEQRDSARRHLDAALARARAAEDEAGVALALLRLALCEQGDRDAAGKQLLDQAAELFHDLGNRRGQLWCLAELGFAHLTTGDLDQAAPAFRGGLALARELGYLHGEAWMQDALGETAGAAGSFVESRSHFEAAHAIQQRLGDELNRGWTIGGLVRAHLGAGEVADAVRWLEEFARYLSNHDPAWVALNEYAFLLRAGCVAIAGGFPEHAARMLGAMDALEPPPTLSPTDHEDHGFLEQKVAAALGPRELTEARRRGQGVPPLDLARQLLDTYARSSH